MIIVNYRKLASTEIGYASIHSIWKIMTTLDIIKEYKSKYKI